MQSISIPQINRRHPNPLPTFITRIILLKLLRPEFLRLRGAILAKALRYEKLGEFLSRHEVRRGLIVLCAEVARDEVGEGIQSLPAAKLATAFGFKVERCSEGNYTLDLYVADFQRVSYYFLFWGGGG